MNTHGALGWESAPAFGARTDVAGETALVTLQGELDMAAAPLLKSRLSQLQENGVQIIVLDFRGLSFIDSAGAQAVVMARSRGAANAQRLVVVGVRPGTRRVFDITYPEFALDDPDAAGVFAPFTTDRMTNTVQIAALQRVVDA